MRAVVLTAAGGILGFPILSTIALQRTTSAHAAVVIATLPLATAVWAVRRAGEHPPRSFWLAAGTGTATVAGFALLRGGAQGGSLFADLLLVAAVAAASFGYAEGAVLARSYAGWKVVSWTLVVSAPLTVPVTAAAMWLHRGQGAPGWQPTMALAYQAVITAYLAYLLWYRGLAQAGVARGSQLQNFQPLLTVMWSAVLLSEPVGTVTIGTTCIVLVCVVLAQRARTRVAVRVDVGPTPVRSPEH